MSRALKRWQSFFKAVPQDAIITERDHRSMKRLLSRCPEGADYDEWCDLFDTINDAASSNKIAITPEHHAKGQEWLRKSIGYIRRYCEKFYCGGLDEFESAASAGVKAFYFGGFVDATPNFTRNHYGHLRTVIPIWRVVLHDGREFSYAYSSWQSNSGLRFNPDTYEA